MKKNLKITATLVGLLIVCISACVAGLSYDVFARKTIWVDQPTPASFWVRDANQDVYTIGYAAIFDDTPRMMTTTNTTITVHPYYTGYWELDSNGDTAVRLLTGYADHRKDAWARQDQQWGMDENGDIYPYR